MSTLNDNDLMLIERDGVQYKVESQYVNVGPDGTITSPVEVLTPVDGDGLIVGTQDGVITSAITAVDGDTITFASDVSSSLEAPISMVDANGDPIAPTTSVVSSVTSVPAVEVSKSTYNFHWAGSTTINTGVSGNRMVWFKNYGTGYGVISDSVNFDGQYIPTGGDTKSAQSNGITFNADSITSAGLMGASGTDHAFLFELVESAEVFDIVNYTGDGSSSNVIPHNLGVEPGMIIIKKPNSNGMDWVVWHKDLNPTQGLALNLYHAQALVGAKVTAVSSETFTINSVPAANDAGASFVAYVFAADTAGKIKCGTYQGNSSDLTVNVGFKPGFVLLKNIDEGYNWAASTLELMEWGTGTWWKPDSDDAIQVNSSYRFNATDTGFRLTGAAGTTNNGDNFIYLAIANEIASEATTELTFQDNTNLDQLTSGTTITSSGAGQETGQLTADADPSTNTAIVNTSSWPTGDSVYGTATTATASSFNTGSYSNSGFSATTYTGTGSGMSISTGVDLSTKGLIWFKGIGGSGFATNQHSHFLFDSERNNYGDYLRSNESDKQMSFADYGWEPQPAADGTISNLKVNLQHSNVDYVAWAFRAMPGFFDVVTYDGDPNTAYVPQNIPHDLGTAPGMMIIKNLGPYHGVDWVVYHKELGATQYVLLNNVYGAGTATNMFNNTEPTDSEFTVGAFSAGTNNNGSSYVAYLFADNPSQGIKCGSYSGNDGTQTIDCGFGSDKAAFIMVKCTSHSSPSGWIMCDTSRPDGSDQTLHDIYANLKISQLNNGRIGSVAGGFTLNDGNNDVNRAGRTYIYMAISETNGSFGNLASNQIKANGVTGTFQVGANVKGADYIYEISSQSSAITAVDGNLLTFTNQDGLVEMTAPVSTDTGTATGFTYGSYTLPTGETAELETNQAALQGITGTFSVGQTVTGSAQVADHPLTSEIEFKSVNGASGTGEFNGTDCTLNARIWTLETASNINGPWTVVDTYIDTDANASQDGATPWTTGTPTLQPNTIYRVKVKYQTADSAPVESTYHTFKTGAS